MRTVFVVGAGASVEFKGSGTMPVGSELAVQIEHLLDEEFQSMRENKLGPLSPAITRQYGQITADHLSAMTRIRNGIQSKNSIDDFVDEWADMPEIQNIAKLCIAECILRAERTSILASLNIKADSNASTLRDLRSTWLGTVVRLINPQAPRRDVAASFDGVSFITFNYDRCIETFLYHHFVSTLGLSSKAAREAIGAIPIYHVYGDLGDVVDASGLATPFGGRGGLSATSNDIKTYSEEIGSSQQRRILDLTRNADKIVFLGCAYHRQNLRLIYGGDITDLSAQVWGTTMGLSARRLEAVREYFAPSGMSFTALDGRCSDMLNQYEEDIFEEGR